MPVVWKGFLWKRVQSIFLLVLLPPEVLLLLSPACMYKPHLFTAGGHGAVFKAACREAASSASDRQGSKYESCVWRAVSSHSSRHPQPRCVQRWPKTPFISFRFSFIYLAFIHLILHSHSVKCTLLTKMCNLILLYKCSKIVNTIIIFFSGMHCLFIISGIYNNQWSIDRKCKKR